MMCRNILFFFLAKDESSSADKAVSVNFVMLSYETDFKPCSQSSLSVEWSVRLSLGVMINDWSAFAFPHS